jgi:hypothetical protein
MTQRFRIKDNRINGISGTVFQDLSKRSGCSSSATWATFSSVDGESHREGLYKTMDDVVGNAPRRGAGVAGYRFNAMSSRSVTVDKGTGSNWEVEGTAINCSGSEAYKQRFRCVDAGVTLGRRTSGFSTYPIDSSTGRITIPFGVSPTLVNRALSLATTSVWSKRGRGGSNSNLYESLAEVDKTLAMFKGYIDSARKIYLRAQHDRPDLMVREASSIYLMTRYGFAPTVSDIFHIIEALKVNLGVVLESTRSQEIVSDFTSLSRSSSDAATIRISGTTTTQNVARIRVLSVDQYNRTILDALGFGYKNLATVPWELMSNSFIYDWFANIGDFIGSMIPAFGLTQIGSCTVLEQESTQIWVGNNSEIINPSTFTMISAPTSVTCKRVLKSYSRSIGLGAPSLAFKLDFKFSNLTRALDAVTLLIGKLPVKHLNDFNRALNKRGKKLFSNTRNYTE